jgi:hypothetical protein
VLSESDVVGHAVGHVAAVADAMLAARLCSNRLNPHGRLVHPSRHPGHVYRFTSDGQSCHLRKVFLKWWRVLYICARSFFAATSLEQPRFTMFLFRTSPSRYLKEEGVGSSFRGGVNKLGHGIIGMAAIL